MSTTSSLSDGRTGLGIDLCSESHSNSLRSVPHPAHIQPRDPVSCAPEHRNGTLRSSGLLRAEAGDAMVEFDHHTGIRAGHRIALEAVTPGGGSRPHSATTSASSSRRGSLSAAESSLSRHGTLLSVGAEPGRTAAELKSLLGNSSARLKYGAAVLPPPGSKAHPRDDVALEQAKPRARVKVDIILESDTCVQGSYLKGHVKVRVRRRTKKESPVLLAGGKVRVVGFECIPHADNRYTFFQCAAPLEAVAASAQTLYTGHPDPEGFAEAREGVHIFPFALFLPLDGPCGRAKGVINVHSGVAVRYIAIASIKVKDSSTNNRSIAHFYRNCEIWPRLDPSAILVSAPSALRAATAKTLFLGGPGKLRLSARLHRLHWLAGQRCCVAVNVANGTTKTVRRVVLALMRTTVVFRPRAQGDGDPDTCETATTVRQVAEATLEMGQRGAKGHASAKGWWTGVTPGETLEFSHFIPLPPDALSVIRGRLLEVEYTIRVSLSAGSLTSDVQVVLPIRIINFLSVDPPPALVRNPESASQSRPSTPNHSGNRSHSNVSRNFTSHDESPPSPAYSESVYDDDPSDYADDDCSQFDSDGSSISFHESDDELAYALSAREEDEHAVPQNSSSFADLYLAEKRERISVPHRHSHSRHHSGEIRPPHPSREDPEPEPEPRGRPRSKTTTAPGPPTRVRALHPRRSLGPRPRPRLSKGSTPFALRVAEKLRAAAAAGTVSSNPRTDSGSISASDTDEQLCTGLEEAWTPRTADALPGPTVLKLVNPDPASARSSVIASRGEPTNGSTYLQDDVGEITPMQTKEQPKFFQNLPHPPSLTSLSDASSPTIPAPTSIPVSVSVSVSLHTAAATPINNVRARSEDPPGAVETGRRRPPLKRASASSVRAKIMELEQRVRAADIGV